jgi:alpha-glucosidase (family GH31 glycosyl hydrolase)
MWPGDVAYPDWLNSNASDYWQDWLGKFYEQVKFDGIWADENEATSRGIY